MRSSGGLVCLHGRLSLSRGSVARHGGCSLENSVCSWPCVAVEFIGQPHLCCRLDASNGNAGRLGFWNLEMHSACPYLLHPMSSIWFASICLVQFPAETAEGAERYIRYILQHLGHGTESGVQLAGWLTTFKPPRADEATARESSTRYQYTCHF